MAIQAMRCYHHSNCEDRPAVSSCSKCGKGLCKECTDKLRSSHTNKILCVDCLNEELAADAAVAIRAKRSIKKELITMIVGGVIGLIVMGIILGTAKSGGMLADISFIAFFMPTLFASLGTIFSISRDWGFLLGVLIFIVLMFISPIIFLWRLIRRIKDIVVMKKFVEYQSLLYAANNSYYQAAQMMSTKKESQEEFERRIQQKYAILQKSNAEEYERKLAEEREQRVAAQQAEEAANVKANEAAQQLNEMQDKLDALRMDARRAGDKPTMRKTEKVASGKTAA